MNMIHMGDVNPVEALELPIPTRNLDLLRTFLTLFDRVFSGHSAVPWPPGCAGGQAHVSVHRDFIP